MRIYDAAKQAHDQVSSFTGFRRRMREKGFSEEDIRHAWDLLTEEHGSQGREHSLENPLAL